MRRPVVALLLAVALAASACGGDTKVGDDSTLGGEEQEGGRLGEIERTTVPPSTAAPTTAAPTTAPPTTRAVVATTAATARTASGAVTIEITSQRYEPFNFAVKRGTTLRVVNRDSQSRTFTSDEPGLFDSGPIAPGATFTYVAEKLGKHNFHDETRPFVVGQMEVTP